MQSLNFWAEHDINGLNLISPWFHINKIMPQVYLLRVGIRGGQYLAIIANAQA